MPTDCLFRDDSYLKQCEARVLAVTEQGGIVLDRTVFYAASGGQPGDSGALAASRRHPRRHRERDLYRRRQDRDRACAGRRPPALKVGDAVTALIDWDKRYGRMRVHTALHLLSAVLPYAVTGGSVGESEGRLDFDIPDAGLDKDAITGKLAAMVASNAAVSSRWISDDELAANPGLVKTMSVKPPVGSGRVRLIEIEGLDLQPCGGTHVRGHRRNRPGAGDADREEGQIEPPRAHCVSIRRNTMSNSKPTSPWLKSTAWLADNLKNVVVVDGSFYLAIQQRDAKAEYLAGHIPGALFFDINAIADHTTESAAHAAGPGAVRRHGGRARHRRGRHHRRL